MNSIEPASEAKLAASYRSSAYVSSWPEGTVREFKLCDDKAELQEFEQTALEPTLNIAYRYCWWLTGMQRLLRFTAGSFLVAQCPSEQKLFVAEILNFFDAGLLASSRPLRITSFMT